MNKKVIISLVAGILVLTMVVVSVIIFNNINNKIVSTITLDINPSIEIDLNNQEKVVNIIALNNDAKEIINDNLKGKSIDEFLGNITDKLINKGYANEEELLEVILYTNGNISNRILEEKLTNTFKEKRIVSDIIIVDKITNDDEELAKKYNVSAAKVSYIKSIVKENEHVNLEDLTDKPVNELKEIKETKMYCDKGYTLDNKSCFKEKEIIDALKGSVCPDDYVEYNGACHKETRAIESEQFICREGFNLVENDCVNTETHKAEKKCNKGELRGDKCLEKIVVGEASEFCRDPGRTLYNHKCLATKPSINGGCLNGDMLLNGKCVNTRNDYYMAEWKCPNGQIKSNADGSLLDNDTHCYSEKENSDFSYSCGDGDYILEGDECTITYKEPPRVEIKCKNGTIKVDDSRCIDLSDIKEKIEGYYCEGDNTRLEGNKCIIYDVVEAKVY